MDRSSLLNHIRATHFESGDRKLALADAQRISAYLVKQGARRVVGIGSWRLFPTPGSTSGSPADHPPNHPLDVRRITR